MYGGEKEEEARLAKQKNKQAEAVETLKQKNVGDAAELERLQKEQAKLADSGTTLTRNITSLQSEIEQQQQQVDLLSAANKKKAEEEIPKLNHDKDALDDKIRQLRQVISTMQNDLSTAQTSVRDIESELSALKQREADAKREIADHSSRQKHTSQGDQSPVCPPPQKPPRCRCDWYFNGCDAILY